MAFSETRIIVGGLAHVIVLIFVTNLIKSKFLIKTEEAKDNIVKDKAKTWKTFNKLTIYTIIFVAIILIIIFSLF